MATRVADRALLDTNVLLAATDAGRAHHRGALKVINDWPQSGAALYTSGQILREYLSVATRPTAQNGLGLARDDAIANGHALYTRLRYLAEGGKVTERLLALLADVECSGKQIHDANVVATAVAHGIGAVITSNVGDFARFTRYIDVVDLGDQIPA